MNQNTFSKVDKFSGNLLNHNDDIIKTIEKNLFTEELPPINVSPSQGQFLKIMALAVQAKRILEIGTLGGYSAIHLGKALPENGKLISLELEADYAKLARQNIKLAGLYSKIEIITGPAIKSLIELTEKNTAPFDLIFLDADKPNYPHYLKWMLKLSHPGTFIISDNVVREGEIIDPDSTDAKVIGVQQFLHQMSQEKQLTSTILQTVSVKGYDGMAISIVQ